MTGPLIGRNGIVLYGAVPIGYVQGITVSIGADVIKDYSMDSNYPGALGYGSMTITFTIDKMYIDKTYAELLTAKTPSLTIEVRPEGTGSTKPKIIMTNVVLTSWDMTIEQDGVILESLSGEAISIAFGTQT